MTGLDAGFLAMLKAPVGWQKLTGKDSFGNKTYGPEEGIRGFVDDISDSYGTGDNDQLPGRTVTTGSVILNYQPIGTGDILKIGGQTYYASKVVTVRDQTGDPLYHEVEITSEQEG